MQASESEKMMGLSYSLDHLNEMKHKIISLPREEQSQYADGMVRKFATDKTFLDRHLDSIGAATANYPAWNTTSVGNIAYMLLNLPLTDPQREKLTQLLEGYQKWKADGYSGCTVS